jgi:branched-chain amino acid transport system substrate-binding protein
MAPLQAQEPIKIGFSVSLTGGLASSGKAHLLSKQIWAEEINAKGGLLGRPVKLVYFDDQTNAANVPGIYSKLMDVDKVDLLMGAATNLIVAAMPHIMARKKMVMVRRSAPMPSSSIPDISRAPHSGRRAFYPTPF